jgi:hypothetical protein
MNESLSQRLVLSALTSQWSSRVGRKFWDFSGTAAGLSCAVWIATSPRGMPLRESCAPSFVFFTATSLKIEAVAASLRPFR